MSNSQLLIPKKISVGFQERKDTYTGKLAYVIYWDYKNVLRKERSWQKWSDDNIPKVDFENVPTEGFVLNKGVGGARQSYGWDTRNEYIRVYDPRDFEFEISVANLLFILRECDCSKGKGLEGQFVYAWQGTELVLLPVTSSDYQNSVEYTKLQEGKIGKKEVIPGATYLTKDQQTWVYLGKFLHHDNYYGNKKDVKKFIFIKDGKTFIPQSGMSKLAKCLDTNCHPDFALYVEGYNCSHHGAPIDKLVIEDFNSQHNHYYYNKFHHEFEPGKFGCYDFKNRFAFKEGNVPVYECTYWYEIENGCFVRKTEEEMYPNPRWEPYTYQDKTLIRDKIVDTRSDLKPTKLVALTKGGFKIDIGHYY